MHISTVSVLPSSDIRICNVFLLHSLFLMLLVLELASANPLTSISMSSLVSTREAVLDEDMYSSRPTTPGKKIKTFKNMLVSNVGSVYDDLHTGATVFSVDESLETALTSGAGTSVINGDISPRTHFLGFCIQEGITPFPKMLLRRELNSTTMNLAHFGIGDKCKFSINL